MNPFTFSKSERISSRREIDLLFEQGHSFLVYPLRIVFLSIPKTDDSVPVSVLISVPKRKLKRAVHRNRIKRLIRETYRLNKQDLLQKTFDSGRLLIAFVYLSGKIVSYREIDEVMKKALHGLMEKQA